VDVGSVPLHVKRFFYVKIIIGSQKMVKLTRKHNTKGGIMMWKKVSVSLFAVLLFTACGTADDQAPPNMPENDDMPENQDIAPDNDNNDLDQRDNDPIDEPNRDDIDEDRMNDDNLDRDTDTDNDRMNDDNLDQGDTNDNRNVE